MNQTLFLSCLFFMMACKEENPVPRPASYLRLELPDHSYTTYSDGCDYSFDVSELYQVLPAPAENGNECHKRIELGPLNGTAYIRYWNIGGEPLAFFVNSANDEIDRHKLKADNIADENIIRESDRVFGTFFELQGDVATPFQFYLTDSISHFLYCEVLFNSAPNYDSLRPTLQYVKKDLKHLTETLQWK